MLKPDFGLNAWHAVTDQPEETALRKCKPYDKLVREWSRHFAGDRGEYEAALLLRAHENTCKKCVTKLVAFRLEGKLPERDTMREHYAWLGDER